MLVYARSFILASTTCKLRALCERDGGLGEGFLPSKEVKLSVTEAGRVRGISRLMMWLLCMYGLGCLYVLHCNTC